MRTSAAKTPWARENLGLLSLLMVISRDRSADESMEDDLASEMVAA